MKVSKAKPAAACMTWLCLGGISLGQATSQDKQLPTFQLARLEDGLHRAALANGGRYSGCCLEPPLVMFTSTDYMADASEAIFIGNVVSSSSALIDDGRQIETFYEVKVGRVLTGSIASARIKFGLQGGAFNFSDGTRATLRARDIPALLPSGRYLFFANRLGATADEWESSAWDQGVFQLDSDGTHMQSLAAKPDHQFASETKEGQSRFLARLEDHIKSEAGKTAHTTPLPSCLPPTQPQRLKTQRN